jgi:hypothetical protein
MGEFVFEGGVTVSSIGSESRSVVGAIGKNAVGTVNGHSSKSKSDGAKTTVVGAIGDEAVGTVNTDGTSDNVVGAIGDNAVGTVNIRD